MSISMPFDRPSGPYTHINFAEPYLYRGAGVIAGTGELEATPNGNGVVQIIAGEAICYTQYYTNDAGVDVAIAAAANNRIDRICLRYSGANERVRITKIQGTPAANPSPPALTALSDIPLWWIWVPAGFDPAINAIATQDIHDEREFLLNSTVAATTTGINMIHNSEFLAFSAATLGTDAPEFWHITAAPPTSITAAARSADQARGNAVRIQGAAGEGMRMPGTKALPASNMGVTFRGSLNIASGSVRVTVGSTAKDFYRTGVQQDVIIRVDGNSTCFPITIEAHGAGSDFTVSQLLLVSGKAAGNFRPKHEIIMLDYAVTDANWAATAKSTGTTNINLSTDFGTLIPDHVRGLIVRMRANDSGSAAGAPRLMLYHARSATPVAILYLDGAPNDDIREIVGYVPTHFDTTNIDFKIGVTATGAGTLDATIEIIGIIT
jgi:hypothetical protein